MTLYGVDISAFQAGIDVRRLAAEGFSWIEAKVSEGDYYTDHTWPTVRDAATQAGIPIIGYHYANASCAPAAQVQTWLGNGGPNVCMLDFEDHSGTISDYWTLVNAFNAAGVTVALSYIPQWYWEQIGSPDLSQVPGLIASNYLGGTGFASDLYAAAGGDSGHGWAPYGGASPVMWQFTDRASVAGMSVDADAFKGSQSDLVALLTGRPQGGLMALTDDQQNQLLAAVLDIQAQLRGPSLNGWPQLGKNAAGQDLTVVDALASIKGTVEGKP